MLDSMFDLLPGLGNYLATYLIHSTILLGATWILLRRFLRERHGLRAQIWKTAALLSVVTPMLQTLAGIQPAIDLTKNVVANESSAQLGMSHTESDNAAFDHDVNHATPRIRHLKEVNELMLEDDHEARESLIGTDHPARSFDSEDSDETTISKHETVTASLEVADAMTNESEWPTLSNLIPISIGAVIVLFTIGLIRALWQSASFRMRLSHCQRVDRGATFSTLARLTNEARITRRVTLLQSTIHVEPVAFGFFRWRIVVPASIEQRLSPEEIHAVLAHELAHLVRGDTMWLAIGRWLCTCLAIQPMNFVARREWRRAAEFECDDWAVQNSVDALILARCLTTIAEWRMNNRVCATTLAAIGTKSDLTGRVKRLVEQQTTLSLWETRFRQLVVAIGCCVTASTIVVWGPSAILFASNSLETESVKPSESTAKEVNSEDNAITSALRELQDELDVLNSEMQTINQLIKKRGYSERVQSVAQRLQDRIQQLNIQRQLIVDLSQKIDSSDLQHDKHNPSD